MIEIVMVMIDFFMVVPPLDFVFKQRVFDLLLFECFVYLVLFSFCEWHLFSLLSVMLFHLQTASCLRFLMVKNNQLMENPFAIPVY